MQQIITLMETYRYLILFPLAALEGPVISLIAGFLVRLGYLSFIPAYFIMVFGDMIPDTIYYYIGRYGKRRNFLDKHKNKGGFLSNNIEVIEKLWREHGRSTMTLSKLAYGLSTPFLISAGLVDMPLSTFLSYTLPVTLIQYAALLAIGYFLGQSFETATKYIKYGGFLIAGIFIIFIAAYVYTLNIAKKRLVKMEKLEESKEKAEEK